MIGALSRDLSFFIQILHPSLKLAWGKYVTSSDDGQSGFSAMCQDSSPLYPGNLLSQTPTHFP